MVKRDKVIISKAALSVEIEKILSRSKPKHFLKGQYIGQEGEIAKTQTFIVEGSARTFYLDNKGNEHIYAFGIDDWWVGDINSLK